MREASAKEAHLFATQKIENLKLMDKSRMAMRKLERELVTISTHLLSSSSTARNKLSLSKRTWRPSTSSKMSSRL